MELTPSAERKWEGRVAAELLNSGNITMKIVKFRVFFLRGEGGPIVVPRISVLVFLQFYN